MSYLLLDDYRIPGYDLRVGLTLKLKDEDASGETSSTAKVSKGAKGKKLDVQTKIKFSNEQDLKELFRIAEAGANGKQKVYALTNPTGNAVGMRQATFTRDIKVTPQDGVRAWVVDFVLAEHKSIPEMAESRQAKKEESVVQNTGQTVEAPAEATAEKPEELGTMEKVLKATDDWIGDGKEVEK